MEDSVYIWKVGRRILFSSLVVSSPHGIGLFVIEGKNNSFSVLGERRDLRIVGEEAIISSLYKYRPNTLVLQETLSYLIERFGLEITDKIASLVGAIVRVTRLTIGGKHPVISSQLDEVIGRHESVVVLVFSLTPRSIVVVCLFKFAAEKLEVGL